MGDDQFASFDLDLRDAGQPGDSWVVGETCSCFFKRIAAVVVIIPIQVVGDIAGGFEGGEVEGIGNTALG